MCFCRQKKKDEPKHEVIYRLVSTDNNFGEGQVSIPVSPNPGSNNKLSTTPDPEKFTHVDPELGSEDYEYSQIRVIPGSGDALALHQGAPPAADPLEDTEGYFTHDHTTIPDISRFHGYHAISPILSGKDTQRQNNYQDKGDTRETLSGDYDNVLVEGTRNLQNESLRYPANNYTTIHQFVHPQNSSTPNVKANGGINGNGNTFGQGNGNTFGQGNGNTFGQGNGNAFGQGGNGNSFGPQKSTF